MTPTLPKTRTVIRMRYGVWGGQPFGVARDVRRCFAAVHPTSAWGPAQEHQCSARPLPGSTLCRRHQKMADAGRELRQGTAMRLVQEWDGDLWTTIKAERI